MKPNAMQKVKAKQPMKAQKKNKKKNPKVKKRKINGEDRNARKRVGDYI